MKNFIKKKFTFQQITIIALIIISLRVFVEFLLLDKYFGIGIFYEYSRFYLEILFYFLMIFFLVSFAINKIAKIPFKKVANYGIKMLPIIIMPPILDFFIFNIRGNYSYAKVENYLGNILTLSLSTGDATPGIIIEIITLLFLIGIFVFYVTKSTIKTILSVLSTLVILVTISTPDLFFGIGKGNAHTEHFISSYYILPFLFLSILICYNLQKTKLIGILSNLRYVKSAIYVVVVILGAISSYAFGYPFELYEVILASLVLFFIWQVAIILNDISDIKIDRITNKERPLVKKIITKKEYRFTSYILMFFTLSISALLGFHIFLLSSIGLILAFIYSKRSFRLKAILGLGNAIIGISLVIAFAVGILLSKDYNLLFYSKNTQFFAMLFIFGFLLSFSKDFKDIKSDSLFKIKNIYTVYGRKKGFKIISVLIFIGVNSPALIFQNIIFLPITLVFSLLTLYVYSKKKDEKLTFALAALLGLIIFFLFYFPGVPIFKEKESIDNSILRGITFLEHDQLPYGEFKTFVSLNEKLYFDSSPFTTSFVIYSLKDIETKKSNLIKEKAAKFLLEEQEQNGMWRYWSSRNYRNDKNSVPPDLDDISTISYALKILNKNFGANIDIVQKNRNQNGVFLTWVLKKEDSWPSDLFNSEEIDCVVNANTLLYLNKSKDRACNYINKAISDKNCDSKYYKGINVKYYTISRAYSNGVICLKKSKNQIISELLKALKSGQIDNDQDLALALNALMMYNYNGKEIETNIKKLIKNQNLDGSWDAGIFFGSNNEPYLYKNKKKHYYTYSKSLATAMAIESLDRYKKLQKN